MEVLQEVWNTGHVYKDLVFEILVQFQKAGLKDTSLLVCLFQKDSCEGWRNAAEMHGKGKQNESIVNQLSSHAITIIPAL